MPFDNCIILQPDLSGRFDNSEMSGERKLSASLSGKPAMTKCIKIYISLPVI
jgi:hypothetical protein